MKGIFFAILGMLIFFNTESSCAEKSSWTIRGADYKFEGLSLAITEKSYKLIDRADNGNHAKKIINGEIAFLPVKPVLEKLYNLHGSFSEITPNPKDDLTIEFEGWISNVEIRHICRGEDGNYLSLSAPEIYYAENLSLDTSNGKILIKELIIGTDPSEGLLLQKDFLKGFLSNYWRFFMEHLDYNGKVEVQGIINYAEQISNKNEIEKLELIITVIKITPISQ